MAFTTRKSLLARVRSGDEVSWREFYAVYKPLIFLCGSDCGLSADEKEELVQQVMGEIFRKDILQKYDIDHVPDNIVFAYDPARGRFRYYLKKIIRNQALKIRRARRQHESDELLDSKLSEDSWDSAWEEEWQKHLFSMALAELRNRVQPETYVAFEMYALQNRTVQETAAFLNLSATAVYTAKSRCLSALKEIVKQLDER